MGETQDLGRRIELFSMDVNCLDISLALYRRGTGESARVLVHSYSQLDGVTERVGFISQALQVKAGLEPVPGESGWLKFPCDGFHQRALTRAFLDVCKLASGTPLAVEPLSKFDKKADCNLSAVELGGGVYEMRPDQQTEAGHKRASALTRGFVKLCQMEAIEDHPDRAAFFCKTSHNALMGTLMYRAQNLRAAMREQESTASRGVLAAPSQQE